MRFIIVTMLISLSSFSQAATEASVSERILRRKLLNVLQGTHVAIAQNSGFGIFRPPDRV